MSQVLFDDELDRILCARGWWSRRDHGVRNDYKPRFDAWGWGPQEPGDVDIRCIDKARYEVSWLGADVGEAHSITFDSRDALVARLDEFERLS